MNTPQITPTPSFFRPAAFLAGFGLALALCLLIGRRAGNADYHKDFVRFHPMIGPESYYYPTVREMCSIVRAHCRSDQVLVIVGGNSIFYGVGQPVDQVWTKRLQELLGDRYAVVNFAFRGSTPTDVGAVVAEVFRDEFPRQIYVANTGPLQPIDPIGSAPYRFMFWEAYYKGLLMRFPVRDERITDFLLQGEGKGTKTEIVARVWLDRLLHYRDFWNYVGYNWVFTVATPYTPRLPGLLFPKKTFVDNETDYDALPFGQRFRSEINEPEMRIVRGFTELAYRHDADGRWNLEAAVQNQFRGFLKMGMPDPLKRRTLIVLSGNSPFYVKQLSLDERRRDELGYADSLRLWREMGYNAVKYGSDFRAEDFGDRTHLTAAGGRKVAEIVAPEIRAIAEQLGYLKKGE